jgi:hypothetical protein
MPARATAARFDIAGDEFHGARAAGQHGVPTWVSSGCWARRALGRAGGHCARPSLAWARRRRHGDGAGDLTRAGARRREGGRRARGCARGSGYYCRSTGLGSRRGVVAAFTAELGSTPWVAASAAPVVGWREREGVHGGVCRRPRTRHSFLLATVRVSHKATVGSRRRGRPRHGAERRRRHKKGPKARPCLQGYGARVLGCTLARERRGPHGRARTHTRRGRDEGAPTRRGGDQTDGVIRLEG